MLELFTVLAAYNQAANREVLGLVAKLDAGAAAAPRGSYFGSIHGLLEHLMSGDINWLRRFRLLYPELALLAHPILDPPGAAWTKYPYADFPSLAADRTVVDGLYVDFAASLDTGRLDQVLAYNDSGGNPRRYIAWQALVHVFNHQTHHRGQISQILDELGVEHDFSNLIAVLAPR